jgi:Leucine-rich repeat (LRR) protein
MKNNNINYKLILIGALIALCPFLGFAQVKKTTNPKTNTKSNVKTDPKTTVKTDPKTVKTEPTTINPTADYEKQAKELLEFLEGTLNELGSEYTPVREKQIMINESYTRIFLDDKVQVEDDLDENREIYSFKGVQAYLQDVDFFFKTATFKFKVQTIESLRSSEGQLVYKIKATRHLKGIGIKNDSVNSMIDRYIEINYNENDQSMKIVSMYTTKLNEAEETTNWWNALSPEWKKILKDKSGQTDPIDYNKLKNLLRITDLDISNNQSITDLNAIGKLTRLKSLDCSNTKIKDLYPIRSLNKLEVVNCSNTGIESIEALQYASGMTDLFVDNTKISDITTVENFENLKKLSIENTNVSDIGALVACRNLEDLRISGTKVADFEVLKELGELKILRINALPISSLESITNLKKLEQLSFSATKITDISLLANLQNLQVLYFNNTGVNSLEALKGIKKLEKIYCDNTGIDAAKASNFITALPNCMVMYNSDILSQWWKDMSNEWKGLFLGELKTENPTNEQLNRLSMKKELNLSGKQAFTSLEPASKFSYLSSIDISGTAITDLSPLKSLVDLKRINCSNTKVEKLDDLSGLNRLEHIDISKTLVKDLTPLSKCDNLELIIAENTGVASLKELASLKRLKRIFADNSALTTEAVFAFNEVNDQCLVMYRTEELKKWWANVDNDWKKIFNTYVPFGEKITGEQLHLITVLKEIDVKTQNEIRGLKPLEMLAYLEILKFADTRIFDLYALKDLKNLRELVIPRNPISNIDALAGLKKLEILDLSNTLISKLDPIKDVKSLTVLKVSATKVRWLKSIAGLSELVHLDISGTKVIFIKPIMGMQKLKLLKCYNTSIPGFLMKKFKAKNPECEVLN